MFHLRFRTVLELETVMDELQAKLKKLSKIEMSDDGTTVVSGFSMKRSCQASNEQNVTRSLRDELMAIIAR